MRLGLRRQGVQLSEENTFENTKILKHSRHSDGNPIRVEGVVVYNRESDSFDVLWEWNEEPILKLNKEEVDVLVRNSKYLDLSGLIKSCVGYKVGRNGRKEMICITDKHKIPMIIEYEYEENRIMAEENKLGDSLIIDGKVSPVVLTDLLQLELVAYDDENAYVKYIVGYIDGVDVKMYLSFTKIKMIDYVGCWYTFRLERIDEERKLWNWNIWYKRYRVCDKYSTEFMKYVKESV